MGSFEKKKRKKEDRNLGQNEMISPQLYKQVDDEI